MAARVGVILQARCDSTRLPGKAIATIGGVCMVRRCLNRLRLGGAGHVVLATTERPVDDALVILARRMGVDVYRGSAEDVLQRYIDTARHYGFDVIVRATGDNPAVDIDAASRLIEAMARDGVDYACEDGLPCGAGVEAVTTAALTRSAELARRASDREHVTAHIKAQPNIFRVARLAPPAHLQRPEVRLTVDTLADLTYMRRVFAHVRSSEPSLTEIIAAADACSRSDAA